MSRTLYSTWCPRTFSAFGAPPSPPWLLGRITVEPSHHDRVPALLTAHCRLTDVTNQPTNPTQPTAGVANKFENIGPLASGVEPTELIISFHLTRKWGYYFW